MNIGYGLGKGHDQILDFSMRWLGSKGKNGNWKFVAQWIIKFTPDIVGEKISLLVGNPDFLRKKLGICSWLSQLVKSFTSEMFTSCHGHCTHWLICFLIGMKSDPLSRSKNPTKHFSSSKDVSSLQIRLGNLQKISSWQVFVIFLGWWKRDPCKG